VRTSVPNEGELTIVQRRVGVRLSFAIGYDGVEYSARERLVSRTVFIPFESLNPNQLSEMRVSGSPLFINLFGLSLIYLLMAAAFGSISNEVAAFLIAVSAATSVSAVVGRLTGWTDLRFRLLAILAPAPGAWGPIKIIDGRSGENVLQALRSAWTAKFKRLYGEADLTRDPDKEIARLSWLRDNQVLNEEEWKSQVARVKQTQLQLTRTPDQMH
jgi:hypothetical protein